MAVCGVCGHSQQSGACEVCGLPVRDDGARSAPPRDTTPAPRRHAAPPERVGRCHQCGVMTAHVRCPGCGLPVRFPDD